MHSRPAEKRRGSGREAVLTHAPGSEEWIGNDEGRGCNGALVLQRTELSGLKRHMIPTRKQPIYSLDQPARERAMPVHSIPAECL